MPSSAASMAPVPNAQVPRLRVLVAASREEEAEWLGGGEGSRDPSRESGSHTLGGSTLSGVTLDPTLFGSECLGDSESRGGSCGAGETRELARAAPEHPRDQNAGDFVL